MHTDTIIHEYAQNNEFNISARNISMSDVMKCITLTHTSSTIDSICV